MTNNKLKTLKAELIKSKAELKAMDTQLSDPKAYAQEIIDKMFEAFPKGKEFLDRCVESVNKNQWLISNLGRRRNIWRVITEKPKFLGDASRRAKNSPIQGIASESGSTSGYLVLKELDTYMREFDFDMTDMSLWPEYQRPVHDANYYQQPYCLVIPSMIIKSHMATHGLADYYKEEFGWEFSIEPEIELEVSASEDRSHKWDWQITQARDKSKFKEPEDDGSLGAIIERAVDDQIKLGVITKKEKASVMEEIFEPLNNPKKRKYLLNNYPLLAIDDPEVERRLVEIASKFKATTSKAKYAVNCE